ncbi:MAG: hypothetical protein IJ762_12420, partial [Bacteroidaceae bacterium]|nr:hypothetical protein [Bacteroidaceae bacterium]
RNSKLEKAGVAMIDTPANACGFVQSYSSWTCSPAEHHNASDCGSKGTKSSQMYQRLNEEMHPAI